MLTVNDLKIWFPIRKGIFPRTVGYVHAVDGVSLTLEPGETLGLVGESGCGKTTLGRGIAGLQAITSGQVLFDGQQWSNLRGEELRTARRNLQMVFQDPFASLNPRMCVQDLITEGLAEHGMLGTESKENAATRLMAEVGLDPASRFRFPHEFSGGQRQRISIARALSLQPQYVICDEPVSALDVSVQAQVIHLLKTLQAKRNLSYLFISHDLSVVRLISRRIAVMYLGKIVEMGNAKELLGNPFHPYTQALLSAIPVPGKARTRQKGIPIGESRGFAGTGCPFCPRCPNAKPECKVTAPPLADHQGRLVACHFCK